MGNSETKIDFRKTVIELTSENISKEESDLWNHNWLQTNSAKEIFAIISASDVRLLRENNSANLASLCYKLIQYLVSARDKLVPQADQKKVINCIRLLTRIIPFMFENEEWRGYFWTTFPTENNEKSVPLGSLLLCVLSDLLFCPGFTVLQLPNNSNKESLLKIDTCEYIWQSGVGFSTKVQANPNFDANRVEIMKLLLSCLSEVVYEPNTANRLRWITHFTSAENRHILPMFTSFLNVICSYDPVGYGIPYNYLWSTDNRENLVETSIQLLIVCLDHESMPQSEESGYADNFFVNYLSRVHREEDFEFILKGFTRLLNNTIATTYLPNSVKKITFHQELLVLVWKFCEYNQKFMFYVLKTSDVLELLVPILCHINEARTDPSKIGLVHMGVFLILLLSGERNFGVRLNKPFTLRGVIDVQLFTGTHADLLIIVFHKLITSGNHRLQPLFDCLLTIIVNISPYLKSLSMLTASKLVHLVEAFSTPWFIFSSPTNYHLVFFLLEVFNNIIQYQFDGNSNMIYTIIRKRQVFYQLNNLSSDAVSIAQNMKKGKTKSGILEVKDEQSLASVERPSDSTCESLELKNASSCVNSTLAQTPIISAMVDKSADWSHHKEKSIEPKNDAEWSPSCEWVESWKSKLPLQTIMRMLQILVPQVEKICIDKGLTDETEILKFLQHGTLVGLLPVPHPILIRKYIANSATNNWFRTYTWGVIYLRNIDPPIWIDSEVNLFKIQQL